MPSTGRLEKLRVPLALFALLVLYGATAAQSALGGDGGELAALALRGGVAHPPGYPLFVLYLRALSWIPAGEAAHRAALATVVVGVLAVWLLFRVAISFGASRASAALVAAIYAGSPLAWKLATYPEVFAGNVCIALAIAWFSGPAPPARGAARAAALGLFAGLGLAHHHSIVLVAPLGLYGLFAALREAPRRVRATAFAAGAFVLGLAPYAYDVLAARGAFGPDVVLWGDTSTWRGLVHHFLRRDYGTTTLGAQARARDPIAQLTLFLQTTTRDFFALPVIVAGALIAARGRVLGPRDTRAPRLALLAAIVVAGPLFVSVFNIPPRGLGLLILERFHLLPAALALVFVAPAFDVLFARTRPLIGALVIAALFAVQAVVALPIVAEHHRPTVQRYAENVLAIVEPRAIVVGSGDHRASSFLYAEARGLRPDVEFVQPWLVLADTYRRRESAKLGIELVAPVGEVLDAAALLRQLLATGRPVYLTDWPARGMEKTFATYPIGPLLRIVPDARAVPAPPIVLSLNERAFSVMTLDAAPPPRESWGGALYGDYARPWMALAGAFQNAGDEATAKACAQRAAALTPQ